MYVAVKGGENAIAASHALVDQARRGDLEIAELSVDQIDQQLTLAVDRVMAEGGVHDRGLAALAVKQARGDLVEAIFLLRAYRTTLPRLGAGLPIDTATMQLTRRISATFKDVPGGQLLGPTFDYSHRLLDFTLAAEGREAAPIEAREGAEAVMPRVTDFLGDEGLIEPNAADDAAPIPDLTREPPSYPMNRAARLQALARGDEGWLLGMGYATQRGYGRTHPFAAEIRMGLVEIEIAPEELGFPIVIGEIGVTECQMVNQFAGDEDHPPQFTRGYGLAFGENERKAMAMALVDRALRTTELGEDGDSPTQDQEFVLSHADNVEASGFVQHLKLPHYVDFQSELDLLRRLRAEWRGK